MSNKRQVIRLASDLVKPTIAFIIIIAFITRHRSVLFSIQSPPANFRRVLEKGALKVPNRPRQPKLTEKMEAGEAGESKGLGALREQR